MSSARIVPWILVAALVAAACSGDTVTEPDTTTTTTAAIATTTTSSTTTTITVSPSPLGGVGNRASLGDSLYPGLGNGGYDVARYIVDLFFDPGTGEMAAVVDIQAVATAELDRFNLDFVGFDVLEVVVDGAAADHERADGELIITPARPIAAGEEFAVSVDYAGAPDRIASRASSLPVGWITGADGTSYVIAEPDGASSWYPVNDHPLDKAT